MVTSSAVVGSSAISTCGSQRQRHGDHDPLAHAARELVRIFVEPAPGVGDAHQVEHLERPLARRPPRHAHVAHDVLGDLRADRQHRIEAGHRLLEDHRDAMAAQALHLLLAQRRELLALELDRARGDAAGLGRDQAQDRERRHRLAAARFAHDAQRLAARQVERHAVDRAHHAVQRVELGVRGRGPRGLPQRRSQAPRQPRIEPVAQAVAQQVHRQHGDREEARRGSGSSRARSGRRCGPGR